jgi:DNA-binding protein YbaB
MTEKSFTISLSSDQIAALDQYASDLDLPCRNSGLESIVAVRLRDYRPLDVALTEDAALQEALSEITATIIECQELNGQIRVRLNGDGILQKVKVSPAALADSKAKNLGGFVKSAYDRALKRAEELRRTRLEKFQQASPF